LKAVILAGGEATRLRPLTCHTPKVMVPVANRPFLEHFLNYLKQHRVNQVVLALGYLPDPVKNYFGDGRDFGVELVYSIEDCPLGTAGAVKNTPGEPGSPFLVMNGDVITDIDLTEMLRLHRERQAKVTIALTPVDNPYAFGVVETDSARRILRFTEKPAPGTASTNTVNAGVYVIEPEIMELVATGQRAMFERDVFPVLLARGEPVYAYSSDAYWVDIGTPEKYLKVHHDLLERRVGGRLPFDVDEHGVLYEGLSVVSPGATVKAPVIMGPGCRIAAGAKIGAGTVLGHGCTIEAGADVDGAVLWNDVYVGQNAVLRNCMIASGSRIEAGARVMDFCVLGDRVTVGRDNILDRGLKLWPERALPAGTISF
jgi:NDP-sugar pyrophosphorylase family protein